ncbi:YchJ family protein [Thauera sp. Sel9]|uniref:YchJ family protein n=1 Tax=Thauera sp. Sel9 TaxID=2974299 RepID=UPI0021E168CB|nr:YchJ family metal-binding protein [Thauera sp. Sel9]MCV2217837.1 YchJ family metal-binding protein [Thauera sp. Sel9]
MKTTPCPCESGQPFARCCGPLLAGESAATSAEALMRSRYTAFTRRDAAYLLRTWHGSTRPVTLDLDEDPPPKWIGLKILSRSQPDGNNAQVEFLARYRVGGRARRLHENSRFVREDGLWYYVDGDIDGGTAEGEARQ